MISVYAQTTTSCCGMAQSITNSINNIAYALPMLLDPVMQTPTITIALSYLQISWIGINKTTSQWLGPNADVEYRVSIYGSNIFKSYYFTKDTNYSYEFDVYSQGILYPFKFFFFTFVNFHFVLLFIFKYFIFSRYIAYLEVHDKQVVPAVYSPRSFESNAVKPRFN